ncbi:MAG: PEPxxWA-CTERM sorting domain-containing protein [Nitrosomonas sp.]|uniref:PEP-CTERM sorting domain-containing protein n=1 Tax=Nitrosomonas sp. TaxID=42353 RepID=UPI002732B109|nr:PEP-CTERM sorting domain-containing protein [Nitrosomonas sp.]MDP3279705.1 PEPxxWA-CTERM sorting domain-containing protein [Nitrosomonas sp.]MDP3664348.1 PEPxxWA-CTERM sorting domain-containing protein [Nitrosomonas sp.]MDZ4105370.1 PEPxxWA-CTERM sorting domain-containing protein [Nitrosomonas sp.]
MKAQSLLLQTMLAGAGVLLAASAQATILTFDLDPGVPNYGDIPGSYGDNVNAASDAVGSYLVGNGYTPNVTTDYRTWQISTDTVAFNNLDFWATGYGDLTNVAFSVTSSNHFAEITLVPEPGWAIRLNSFDVGGYYLADHPSSQVRILDGTSNTILIDYSPVTILGTGGTHSTFTPGLTHEGPLSIRFGYNDWNVGIDNINFDQVAVVPEPETYAMLLAGLGLVGFMARRRKQNV